MYGVIIAAVVTKNLEKIKIFLLCFTAVRAHPECATLHSVKLEVHKIISYDVIYDILRHNAN